jgi:hypothetical protein
LIIRFCAFSTNVGVTRTWIYACRLEKTPRRRHAVKGSDHFAFSDIKGLVTQAAWNEDFALLCPVPRKSVINTLVTAMMRIAA